MEDSREHGGQHAAPVHHHGRPPGAPSRRGRMWRIVTPVVLLVSGSLFVLSAVNADGTDLRPGRYKSLATVTQGQVDSYQRLKDQLTTLQDQVGVLSDAVPDSEVQAVSQQVTTMEDPAGLTEVGGDGVSVTLSDAPAKVINSTTLDPNLMVVHQQDIQAVVNALWAGGARAITIAGQRIISTTGIKCSGSTVQLQGIPYPEPYVIQAIGDPDSLRAALRSDPYVSLYRSQAHDPSIDIGWRLDVESSLEAPAYDGVLDLRYATVVTPSPKSSQTATPQG